MSPMLLVVLSVTGLFAALLAFKAATKLRFCVICASVSLTWIGLLIAYRVGAFHDPVIVALLMGQSVVGIYYLAEKRLPERFHVFRLPFLLSATTGAAVLLGRLTGATAVLSLLAALWASFGFVYAYRQDARIKTLADRVVACCKDW